MFIYTHSVTLSDWKDPVRQDHAVSEHACYISFLVAC